MVDTASPPDAPPKPIWRAPSRWQPFVDLGNEARHRRPADVVTLIVAAALLAVMSARAGDVSGWETDVAEFFLDLPSWVAELCEWVLRLGSSWSVVVLSGAALLAKRWRLARDLLLSGLIALLIARVLALLVDPGRTADLSSIFTGDDLPSFPVARVGVATALAATAAPYLVRPLRRYLPIIPLLCAVAALSIPAGLPIDVLAALVLGVAVAAAIHLAFGSPEGRPTLRQVVAAVGQLGVVIEEPRLAPRQPWGEVAVLGQDGDGGPLRVKALGSDAADAKLLARAWHYLWYRGSATRTGNGLDRVNREALVTLLAERAGVTVPAVVAVGGDRELALLVERHASGRPLADLEPGQLTDVVLDRLWRDVRTLHEARLAHGSLDLRHATVNDEGVVQLVGFGHASSPAPPSARRGDIADLLASTGILVGAERAVRAAHRVLGDEPLIDSIGYLQPAALVPELRDAVRAHDKATKTKLLRGLQEAVLLATGAEPPEPVKLQRVSWKGAAMVAATLFGVYILMSQISDVGSAIDEMKDADWAYVAVALVIGQTPAFTDAIATMGAIAQPLPYGPTVLLQLAQKFTGLVVPSTVGVTAMNARYLNLQGVPVATAITAGVIVSVGGFVTQILSFIVCVLLTGPDLSFGSIDASDVGWVVLIGAVLIGAVITLVVVVPKLRAMIVPRVRQAMDEVREVVRNPSMGLRILAGNFGSQVLYSITLGLSLEAYGYSLPLPALIVVNTASSLFAGLMPVPGGIGVAEASLAAGLMAYGVPASVAGAAALTHRIVTFYLPPIWGWFAFRWLSKHEYL